MVLDQRSKQIIVIVFVLMSQCVRTSYEEFLVYIKLLPRSHNLEANFGEELDLVRKYFLAGVTMSLTNKPIRAQYRSVKKYKLLPLIGVV